MANVDSSPSSNDEDILSLHDSRDNDDSQTPEHKSEEVNLTQNNVEDRETEDL